MALLMRVKPSVFSSWNLLGLPRLLNKCVTGQLSMALARRQMSLFALIINLANKNGCGAWGYPVCGARDHLPCGAHWAYKIRSIGGVHRPYKAVTSFRMNIQPTRPTNSIFKGTSSPQGLPRPPSCGSPNRLIATVIELLELPLQG